MGRDLFWILYAITQALGSVLGVFYPTDVVSHNLIQYLYSPLVSVEMQELPLGNGVAYFSWYTP